MRNLTGLVGDPQLFLFDYKSNPVTGMNNARRVPIGFWDDVVSNGIFRTVAVRVN
jgi:hypothetical protein